MVPSPCSCHPRGRSGHPDRGILLVIAREGQRCLEFPIRLDAPRPACVHLVDELPSVKMIAPATTANAVPAMIRTDAIAPLAVSVAVTQNAAVAVSVLAMDVPPQVGYHVHRSLDAELSERHAWAAAGHV